MKSFNEFVNEGIESLDEDHFSPKELAALKKHYRDVKSVAKDIEDYESYDKNKNGKADADRLAKKIRKIAKEDGVLNEATGKFALRDRKTKEVRS